MKGLNTSLLLVKWKLTKLSKKTSQIIKEKSLKKKHYLQLKKQPMEFL